MWSLGVLLYYIITGTWILEGKNFRELQHWILSGCYLVPSLISSQCEHLLKRLLIVNPNNREALEDLMKDTWLHLGQEGELKPCMEPLCDNMDRWVIKEMIKMGFEQALIKESMIHRRYNKLMTTYLILHTKKPKVKGCAIKVRPFPSSDFKSPRSSPVHKVQPSGQKAKEIASPPASLLSKPSTLQCSSDSRTKTLQPNLESKARTP